MTVLHPLTELLELVARHHATVATTLTLREQAAMASFQAASLQMGESANNNEPSSALTIAREFAVNRNEAVYGFQNAIRPLDAQPITVSTFSDSGRAIVRPVSEYHLARFTTAQQRTTTPLRLKPRRRVRAGTVRTAPTPEPHQKPSGKVIHHDFTRKSDLGLVG